MDDVPADTGQRLVWEVQALLQAAGDAMSARFGALTVRGELGGFSRAASGHCYFSLKDDQGSAALLRCAMFRRAASLLDFDARDNQKVEVLGRLAVYEPRGELQFIVEAMRRVAAGTLYEEFLRLKARLASQGLFDAGRKRALPREPRKLGVVTSMSGAALHDVLVALRRRAPHVGVVIYPSTVQGAEAPLALVSALGLANRHGDVDALLLVRGGGSLEDLWAFNDERVVRAVASSSIPVICGVGHETDVTLCDMAADLRAPTPTAAAELAAPSRDELLQGASALRARLLRASERALQVAAQRADRLALRMGDPRVVVGREGQRLVNLGARLARTTAVAGTQHRMELQSTGARLNRAGRRGLERTHGLLEQYRVALDGVNPSQVLRRGYAWVENATGAPVLSAKTVSAGQGITAVWVDGRAQAVVKAVDVSGTQPYGLTD